MRAFSLDPHESTGEHVLAELLSLDDREFVHGAYDRLLGRAPADAELDGWLTPLRRGSRSKLEVLAGIRYSSEGRARAVPVPGLAAPRETGWWHRLPIIGYPVRWVHRLATLPRLARRLDALEAAVTANVGIDAHRAQSIDQVSDAVHGARQRISELSTDVKALSDAAFARHETLTRDLRHLEAVKADRSLVQHANERIRSLWDWVTPVGGVVRGIESGSSSDADEATERGPFDDYYRRFEDHFRGSPEEIRVRLEFYLPIFQGAAQAGMPARFVDLGCGRGELIELLREHGLDAYGVESSEAMVARCYDKGLVAVRGDAVEHLESLAADSLAGVASIHVIEHLPFLQLMELFAQAFRVLRPGGVAIFETPNPENLIVGACNFHYDPTHLRPLPPEPMRFLLEASGFVRVAIERLHPGATMTQVEDASDPIAKLYSTMMLVPQDYALIAYKPSP